MSESLSLVSCCTWWPNASCSLTTACSWDSNASFSASTWHRLRFTRSTSLARVLSVWSSSPSPFPSASSLSLPSPSGLCCANALCRASTCCACSSNAASSRRRRICSLSSSLATSMCWWLCTHTHTHTQPVPVTHQPPSTNTIPPSLPTMVTKRSPSSANCSFKDLFCNIALHWKTVMQHKGLLPSSPLPSPSAPLPPAEGLLVLLHGVEQCLLVHGVTGQPTQLPLQLGQLQLLLCCLPAHTIGRTWQLDTAVPPLGSLLTRLAPCSAAPPGRAGA